MKVTGFVKSSSTQSVLILQLKWRKDELPETFGSNMQLLSYCDLWRYSNALKFGELRGVGVVLGQRK